MCFYLYFFSETEPSTSKAIFDSVRDVMGSYPFNFTRPLLQARILQGGEEGTFGWVTTNYLSNTLNEVGNIMLHIANEIHINPFMLFKVATLCLIITNKESSKFHFQYEI